MLIRRSVVTVVAFLLASSRASAADAPTEVDAKALEESVAKGIGFLQTVGQAPDGSFSNRVGPGVTALTTTALLRLGRTPADPTVAKSLKYLEAFVQPDGSVTTPRPGVANYDTSICLACFALANKDGRYKQTIADAEKFLRGVQRDEGEGRSQANPDYGGFGYSVKSSGADLSNTHMVLEALKAAGAGPDDEAVKRALIFVSRCQNLESEYNTLPFATKVNDGGFYYSPMGEGSSAAGKAEPGALRSYGSMTYAGLKSMVYAGLTADDPRVKAATKWLETNYTLAENPGLGDAGLYYYYHLMAKALDAVGSPTFADDKGVKHNWRAELAAELAHRQQANGSWVNTNNRWFEGDPNLSTAFALLALSYCRNPE